MLILLRTTTELDVYRIHEVSMCHLSEHNRSSLVSILILLMRDNVLSRFDH